MTAIIPWILILTYHNSALDHIEFPGETACKTALVTIVNAKRTGLDNDTFNRGLYGVCVPKGESDYAKMGK